MKKDAFAIRSAINEPRPDHLRIIEALLGAGARLEDTDYPIRNAQLDAILQRHRSTK